MGADKNNNKGGNGVRELQEQGIEDSYDDERGAGVISVAIEGEKRNLVVVTGENVDAVCLGNKLRKKFTIVCVISVEEVKKPKPEQKPEPKPEMCGVCVICFKCESNKCDGGCKPCGKCQSHKCKGQCAFVICSGQCPPWSSCSTCSVKPPYPTCHTSSGSSCPIL